MHVAVVIIALAIPGVSPLACRFCKLDPDTSKECVAYTDFNTNNPNMSTECVTSDRCFRYVDSGKNGSVYFGCTDTTAWTLLKILCHYKLYSHSKGNRTGAEGDPGTKFCFTCNTDKCMATRSSGGRLGCYVQTLYVPLLMYMMK